MYNINRKSYTYRSQAAREIDGTSGGRVSQDRNTHPSPSYKHQTNIIDDLEVLFMHRKEENFITRLTTVFLVAGQKALQSQLSALFSLLTINSVIEQGSRLSETLEVERWRQRLSRRRSNEGYSSNLWFYPRTPQQAHEDSPALTPHECLD